MKQKRTRRVLNILLSCLLAAVMLFGDAITVAHALEINKGIAGVESTLGIGATQEAGSEPADGIAPDTEPSPSQNPIPAIEDEGSSEQKIEASPFFPNAASLGAGNEGIKKEETGTFDQVAEGYYGENGTLTIGSLHTAWEDASLIQVKAGQRVNLRVEWVLNPAATYSYTDHQQPLFDSYENTKISLTLPEGVSIVEGIAGTMQNVVDVLPPSDGNSAWTLLLNTPLDASSGKDGMIVVPLHIDGNGERPVGQTLDFSTPASMETQFTIMDRMNPTEPKPAKTYVKTIQSAENLETKITSTDDVWGIQKNAISAVPSADKSTITVTFKLQVGLWNENKREIITNPDNYEMNGRVPFANAINLEELPCVLNREGTPIAAQSITVTPEFGAKEPIAVDNPNAIELPTNTCAGNTGTNVAGDAPYLSGYTVTIVYPYAEFIANYYDANQQKLNVENKVTLTYKLLGEADARKAEDTASIEAGEVIQPAGISISKYIVDANGGAKLYSASNFPQSQAVTGDAAFAIYQQDGSTPATTYIKSGETYEKQSGNSITINPQSGANGSVTVYLDPGTYIVKEVKTPKNTIKITEGANNANDKELTVEVGKTGTASFYNLEQLGSITIHKQGQKTGEGASPLAGATFVLYDSENKEIKRVTSDSSGNASFTRLPYGIYTVKELDAPEGYRADETAHQFTLSSANADQSIDVVNKYNLAPLQLQKQMYNGTTYENVGLSNYNEFSKCFALEQKDALGEWETVPRYEALSLGEQGSYYAAMPVYDAGGNLITYRFKETMPTGWHKPGDSSASVMYSDPFTLEDVLGESTANPKPIVMQNDRNGSIALTKEFYQLGSNGSEKLDVRETTFTLYRRVEGSSTATAVQDGESTFAGSTEFKDLPRTDSNGNAYLYYLVETPLEGYNAGETQKGTNTAGKSAVDLILAGGKSVKAWGPFDFTAQGGGKAQLAQTITVANYRQLLPAVVKKIDKVTGAFVQNAKFTVYDYTGDQKGNVIIAATEIASNEGIVIHLEPGKKYLVEETYTPAGYLDKTELEERIVDLTDFHAEQVNDSLSYDVITILLQNQPDPKLLINKQFKSSAEEKPLNGISFEVYAKEGTTFTRVNNYNGQPLTVVSGQATQLPAGTYWLKEIIPEGNPDGILDPYTHADLYGTAGEKVEGDGFYFGPVEVTENTTNTTTQYKLTNYAQQGALEITKYAKKTDGTTSPLLGAELAIYREGEEEALQTQKSNREGIVRFEGLPIYDEAGKKITYEIRETKAPEGYTLSPENLKATLEPGKTVLTDTQGEKLELTNVPQVSFQVEKVFRNIWEHAFTARDYLMPGAQIALYHKEADGSYKFVEMRTTDDVGAVVFEGLDQAGTYVAIEYSIPEDAQYSYLEPSKKDAEYLANTYPDAPPETLEAAKLAEYYYVEKAANPGNPVEMVKGTLRNVEHWAQLHIEKFVEEDAGAAGVPEGIEDGKKRAINNAEFDLYMEVLEEGTPKDKELTFEDDTLGKYTFVGSYSSGTLYNDQGIRQDGWFSTNILKAADNVVYWLVERTPGVGATINPQEQIILIRREGTQYQNNTPSLKDGGETCTKVLEYQDDRVSKGEVENNPAYGAGSSMYSTVRIAKWAGALTEDGSRVEKYTPLGNATFDLYLVHEDGSIVEKLDSITTGLDNDLSAPITGQLTAWASSKAFSFNALETAYQAQNIAGVAQDILWKDDAGNGYARVLLVESGTPGGYDAPESGYRLIMFFQYEEGKSSEVFNDAYYVKNAEGEEALAEEQTGWALYPTTETNPGEFALVDGLEGTSQYRIVNWSVDNFAVTVKKYGYEINAQNLGMNSEALNEYYLGINGRTPLSVTMKLQRYDSNAGWVDYSYPTYDGTAAATFTTDADGYFAFPQGLAVGRYRILEIAEASGYESIYTGETVAGNGDYYNAKAYYFQVTKENVQITLYNPKKLALTLQKKDAAGSKVLTGAAFDLKAGTGAVLSAQTGENGVATIENIGSGTYVLSETKAASGYSSAYLETYMQSTYASGYEQGGYRLAEFATSGKGIYLGLQTSLKNGDVVVDKVIDLNEYGIQGLQLQLQDPALCALTIIKQDRQTSAPLIGAQFKLEYQAFQSWKGEESIQDSGWTQKGTYSTEAGGSVQVNNLEPGIYKVTEITAPQGYDLSAEPQYVVLTGDLEKTVTLEEKEIETDSQSLTFQNPAKVSLTVKKKIETGEFGIEEAYKFDFSLYDETKKLLTTQTVTIQADEVEGSVAFQNLSQGKTYYLEETPQTEDFALKQMVGEDGLSLTQDGTLYQFTMPESNAGAAIVATNTYLYGAVEILKVDGEDGTPLTGAHFEAYRIVNGTPMQNATGTVEELGNGEYRVEVPLTSKDGNAFLLREVKAPSGYVSEYPETEVSIHPGEVVKHKAYDPDIMQSSSREENNAAMLGALIFPNYRGSVVQLYKYDNVRETGTTTTLAGATFVLYSKEENEWRTVTNATTESNGMLRFTVESGKTYAVVESDMPSGYAGLQGLWDADNEKMPTETIHEKTGYLLNGGQPMEVGKTYVYHAYNVPYLQLEVRKQDAANPTAAQAPTAKVNIYEVPADTPQTLTQDQVAKLMGENVPLLREIGVETQESGYSYANASTNPALGQKIVSGKTYLIVETESSITQIRDNSNVVWYVVYAVAPDAAGKQVVVTLKNLSGSAEHELTKTTAKAEYESLLHAGAALEYTITPRVDNTYPLTSYVLKDLGLEAKSGDVSLDFDSYLNGKYSITQVTIGVATHNTSAYSETAEKSIQAEVIFYGFDGNKIASKTVDVSTAQQTVYLQAGNQKAKWVEVRYVAPDFEEETGYALGQNFQPGAVTLHIALDKQEGGQSVQAITKVTNRAQAVMEYRPWDQKGIQGSPVSVTREATAENEFGALGTALVSVEKECDTGTLALNGGVATYTVTISNANNAGAAMGNPFLVDLLPPGTVLRGESGNVKLLDPPEGIGLENIRSDTKDGETALFVFLNGKLEPGKQVKVQFEVQSTNAVALYGADINNHVVVGSRDQGVQSQENPRATSFKTAEGNWPNDLATALTSLDSNRVDALRAMLDDMAGFGYIASSNTVTWSADSESSLIKMGKGDRSAALGFTADRLSTVNNNGSMEYQLIFSNLATTFNYTNVTLMDVLPYVGDVTSSGSLRGSQWGMTFESITDVRYIQEDGSSQVLDNTKYKVFYYCAPINDSNINDVYAAVEHIKYDAGSLPQGWSDSATGNVTAIAVAFKQEAEIALAGSESYLVQYKMNVGQLSEEELANRSWSNTVNNFVCQFSRYSGDDVSAATPAATVLSSNSVSGTILPTPVKVGGHVWIDKNANGVWEEGESVSSMGNNSLVQKLLEVIEVRLNTFEGTSASASGTTSYAKGETWKSDANFIFERLDPAVKKDGATEEQLYSRTERNNPLEPAYLKGERPRTYNIVATIPETSNIVASVTSLGGGDASKKTGYSRAPESLGEGGAYAAEAKDNNFLVASSRSFVSERFYLHSTQPSVFDNTKDIGIVLYRNVSLTKVAADNGADPVQGAEFKVYGPFASKDAANAAELNASNLLLTVTTDAQGNAALGKLNWFQVYVIVESKNAAGYRLDGADAISTDGVISKYTGSATANPAWVLGIPEDDVTSSEQKLTITNKREIKYTIQAHKTLSGMELKADAFEFALLDSQSQEIESKRNDMDGSVKFTPISAAGTGEFTYYIQEKIPDEAKENGNVLDGLNYDGSLYKVEVTISWDQETENLRADVAYFRQDGNGAWEPQHAADFVNSYEPLPAKYAPRVSKTFAPGSNVPPKQDGFTFTLALKEGDPKGILMPEDCTANVQGAAQASFDEIHFLQAGTYVFTVREQADPALEAFGYTFDSTEWTLTVTAVDKNGIMEVESHTYTAEGKESSETFAYFENRYVPNEVVFVPAVKKEISGAVPAVENVFRFALELATADPQGGVILPEPARATVTGSGVSTFPEITFRAEGVYTFTITEVNDGLPGCRYDLSQWTLQVVVAEKNGTLNIASYEYSKPNGIFQQSSKEHATFINVFEKDASYSPMINKTFTEQSDPRPSDKTFTFTLKPAEDYGSAVKMPFFGSIFGHRTTVKGQGTAYFSAIRFKEAGSYSFVIQEVGGADPGYVYDGTTWILTVDVEMRNGRLAVTNVVYRNKEGSLVGDKAYFVNAFHTADTPQTGDIFRMFWCAVTMLALGAILFGIAYAKRRKRKS